MESKEGQAALLSKVPLLGGIGVWLKKNGYKYNFKPVVLFIMILTTLCVSVFQSLEVEPFGQTIYSALLAEKEKV
jgi:hypothetical protein